MKDRDTKIIGVVAPNRKIDAVYYDDDDETKSLRLKEKETRG